jgi:hypothetical protein
VVEVLGGTVGAFAYGSVDYGDNRSFDRQDPRYEWNQGLSLYKYLVYIVTAKNTGLNDSKTVLDVWKAA